MIAPENRENGLVGLNPYQARNRIEEFNGMSSVIQRDFIDATTSYFGNLSKVWFSQNAVNFQEKIMPKIEDLDKELVYFVESVVTDACQAYNSLASSHGSSSIYVDSGPFIGANYVKIQSSLDGDIGMDIVKVGSATEEYIERLNSIKAELSKLPRNIAFYDREGSLAGSFGTRVDKINDMVDAAIDEINNVVNSCVEEERTRVKAGADNATSSLL